ncbi:hypothetical protein RB195_006457 [Necator americanus]|uniref:Uncharacterized protein n=1 Tax=Necator americanus TaxID=51031 RepID=A0ABR1BWG6_NECAM
MEEGNGNRRSVRQESPCLNEVEDIKGGCASSCPLRMRVLAGDESLGKGVARYGDADVLFEVDVRRKAARQAKDSLVGPGEAGYDRCAFVYG